MFSQVDVQPLERDLELSAVSVAFSVRSSGSRHVLGMSNADDGFFLLRLCHLWPVIREDVVVSLQYITARASDHVQANLQQVVVRYAFLNN